MKFCPKAFGQDMRIKENLAYCRSIQELERCSRCEFYEHDKSNKKHIRDATKKVSPDRDQGRLF